MDALQYMTKALHVYLMITDALPDLHAIIIHFHRSRNKKGLICTKRQERVTNEDLVSHTMTVETIVACLEKRQCRKWRDKCENYFFGT